MKPPSCSFASTSGFVGWFPVDSDTLNFQTLSHFISPINKSATKKIEQINLWNSQSNSRKLHLFCIVLGYYWLQIYNVRWFPLTFATPCLVGYFNFLPKLPSRQTPERRPKVVTPWKVLISGGLTPQRMESWLIDWRDKTQVKPDNFGDLMNTFKTRATTNYRKLVTFHRPFLEVSCLHCGSPKSMCWFRVVSKQNDCQKHI